MNRTCMAGAVAAAALFCLGCDREEAADTIEKAGENMADGVRQMPDIDVTVNRPTPNAAELNDNTVEDVDVNTDRGPDGVRRTEVEVERR